MNTHTGGHIIRALFFGALCTGLFFGNGWVLGALLLVYALIYGGVVVLALIVDLWFANGILIGVYTAATMCAVFGSTIVRRQLWLS